MKRLIYFTIGIFGIGSLLIMLAQLATETTEVVIPDIDKPAPNKFIEISKSEYLPEGLQSLRMNMSLDEFLKTDHGKLGEVEMGGFRHTVTTQYEGFEFGAVCFYFNNDDNNPLYEFIIEFPDGFDVNQYCKDKYGQPNFDNEWRLKEADGYYVMIWTFEAMNRIIIASNIKGSEHEHRR